MLEGSCLCGAVKFTIDGPISQIEVCHCTRCRKWTGHFFANIEVQRKDLQVDGEQHIRWYASSEKVRRGSCDACGSPLFFDPLDKIKHSWIGVAMGALDSSTGARIGLHIFAEEKGDYYDIPDGEPRNAR